MSGISTRGALGIIAGTGFTELGVLDDQVTADVDTDFGPVRMTTGSWFGRATHFIARHGPGHRVPPHLINYRANIQALADAGVTQILAVNVVGGIGLQAGELVVVDDFINFTTSRELTYFDGSTDAGVVHVDMTEPYDRHLREVLLAAAARCGSAVVDGGVYGAFEGPRFETRAEIRMARTLGVTVVGMTGVPEVVLAGERGIAFASLCLVANPAAGLGTNPITTPITMAEVTQVTSAGAEAVLAILEVAASMLASGRYDDAGGR